MMLRILKTRVLYPVLLLFCIVSSSTLNAQFATIPDSAFVVWLQTNIPGAMSANQMDTTSPLVTGMKQMNVNGRGLYNLTGIRYFTSLTFLDCGNNHLDSVAGLPLSLDTLLCGSNFLSTISYPLPPHLIKWSCYGNYMTALPALSSTLTFLECYSNLLDSLPALPAGMDSLNCWLNHIRTLPALPSTLLYLTCSGNRIHSLPALPSSLIYLDTNGDSLTSLPTLPPSLQSLDCSGNQVTVLPALPSTLQTLACNNNKIMSIPVLPSGFLSLFANYNQLTSIPTLPSSLIQLGCTKNQLTTLPSIPSGIWDLWCDSNQITCFAPFPVGISQLVILGNPATCVPNYVSSMNAATLALPLCTPGNPNGCPAAQGIFGFVYHDKNGDCLRNSGDSNLVNIPLRITDGGGSFLGETYSAINGVYGFVQTPGTYNVMVDTTGAPPFIVQCVYPGLDSLVNLSSLDTNVNFNLQCKPGFDVGVQAVVEQGLVFPGVEHELMTLAGDISRWYNLNCASGISGQVQINVTGPVTYSGPAPGALTPTIAGNVYTFSVPDYGTINNLQAFNMLFTTNPSAQTGDTVKVNIAVTPLAGDLNTNNNSVQYFYLVTNSHDPNRKEVYPVDVPQGYNGWFTYTVHFQNTGTAAVQNMTILDNLDANLDVSTFQLIGHSNPVSTSLNGNTLSCHFTDIQLPDSLHNQTGSQGYIQYRIKPLPTWPTGTQIKNTASIYFDYNSAVVTNTTINTQGIVTGLQEPVLIPRIKVYPVPSRDLVNVESDRNLGLVEVINVLGEKIFERIATDSKLQIDVSRWPHGIYVLRVNGTCSRITVL